MRWGDLSRRELFEEACIGSDGTERMPLA